MDSEVPSTLTGEPAASVNPPDPFPSRIVTVYEERLARARSGTPSRLKSPAAMETGEFPAPMGEPAASAKKIGDAQIPERQSPANVQALRSSHAVWSGTGVPTQDPSWH